MTNLTKLSALALVALIASTSLATAGGIGGLGINIPGFPSGNGLPQPPQPKLPQPPQPKIPFIPVKINLTFLGGDTHHKSAMPDVDCDVRTAVATTNDLWIVNVGNVDLQAGTRLRYSVPSTGDRGGFLLPQTIKIGEKLKVSDLLHGASSGAPCAVKIQM